MINNRSKPPCGSTETNINWCQPHPANAAPAPRDGPGFGEVIPDMDFEVIVATLKDRIGFSVRSPGQH